VLLCAVFFAIHDDDHGKVLGINAPRFAAINPSDLQFSRGSLNVYDRLKQF
jgi:hypothetical protein